MKKLTLVLSVVACTILMLSAWSCKKESDPRFDSKNLIGEWFLSQENYYEIDDDGKTVYKERSYAQDNSSIFFSFFENGEGAETDIGELETSVYDFTWSLSGDQLRLDFDEGVGVVKVNELTVTKLVFFYASIFIDDEEYEVTLIFTKIETD